MEEQPERRTGSPSRSGDYLRLAEAFSELGRHLALTPDVAFDTLLSVAVQRVRGTAFASVTNLRNGAFRTLASTDERATLADELQYALEAGPCVAAIIDAPLYRPHDLAADPRWPEFGRQATALGIHSMLSYRLNLDPELGVGALNLYATTVDAFDDDAVVVGLLLATHGAMAVSAAHGQSQVRQLKRALQSNRLIGTAMGILMAQHKTTQQQAFDLLSIASQHSNRKLSDVADDVIATGELETGACGSADAAPRPRHGTGSRPADG